MPQLRERLLANKEKTRKTTIGRPLQSTVNNQFKLYNYAGKEKLKYQNIKIETHTNTEYK